MHPYVVIPLLVCLGTAMLGSAAVARDPTDRGNWVAGSAISVAGVWCFLDVLINSAPDSAGALFWSRTLGFAYLFLAPLCLDLFCEVQPGARRRLGPWVRGGYWVSAGLATLHWLTPWFIAAVEPTSWGWVYRPGPLFLVSTAYTAGLPLYSVVSLWRERPPDERRLPTVSTAMGAAVLIPVLTATLTDALLPLLGVPSIRVGAMSVALICGSTWLVVVRGNQQAIAASGFARQILDILPDGIALLRSDGRIRSANESLARLLGRGHDSLVGAPVDGFLTEPWADHDRAPDDRESWVSTADGGLVPVSLSTTELRDRQGYLVGRLLAVRDHREVVALRRRLVTSGRLAAVGELSAGIAHEVNNPVAYVHANLNLLKRHAAELAKQGGPAARECAGVDERIDGCLEGVEAVASIVRDVRGLSHADGDARRSLDLGSLIESVVRLASQRLRHGRLELDLPPLPPIECAEQQVKQVFLDLVLNAARVTPAGGRIGIRGEADDDEVRVWVEDEGPPIPPDELVGLFDPLTTGRAVREGRGLGLSISYQILRQHGGRIEVDSSPAAGTRVTLRWPLAAAPGVAS